MNQLFLKRWGFTLGLMIAYTATFASWNSQPRAFVAFSGSIVALILSTGLWLQWRSEYFRSPWDAFAHAAVIVDLGLEAWWIPFHSGHSYLFCATAFLLVVVGYRFNLLHRQTRIRS